jgi:uncharacterized protein with von Willebrand factor type A (vWA) domain
LSRGDAANGKLAENILYFGRALRDAGVPVGPGAVLDALAAVEAVGIGARAEFHDVLQAVFVKRREQALLFDQVFALFWRRKGFVEKLLAIAPDAAAFDDRTSKPDAGARRVADALFNDRRETETPSPMAELDARLTMSSTEILGRKDFAQMSAAEIAEAERRIGQLALSDDWVTTRRHAIAARGPRFDPRASFRRMLRDGAIDLVRQAPKRRHPPVVALVDISGSMNEYSRLFLHFLHALGRSRRVSTFLFGTRLTNATRAMAQRDPDEALARCGAAAEDWAGGTRISENLHQFNLMWSRRVLGQGAVLLLFTDGLERDGLRDLGREAENLRRACRRLVWVNPLLRYDGFAARAGGVRALLPHVDEFRPIHNLSSMAALCSGLDGAAPQARFDPKRWLRQAA